MSVLNKTKSSAKSDRFKRHNKAQDEEDEMLIFGYSCKLYRDDEKALQEDEGTLLIPWMGEKSLMVDRYDIRNRLEDKAQFGLKPNLPVRMSREEEKLEKQLDEERYLCLGKDILEEELLEEEEKKRLVASLAGGNHEVGFSYDQEDQKGKTSKPMEEEEAVLMDQPSLPQHPPTTSVDTVQEGSEEYHTPEGLSIPSTISLPFTMKLHHIIARTAKFVSQHGPQMEIIIKTKQKFNAHFSFLHQSDRLFTYYKHLLQLISNGEYTPVIVEDNETGSSGPEANQRSNGTEEQSDDDDDEEEEEEYDLHPLLRGGNSVKKTAVATSGSSGVVTISSPLASGKKDTPIVKPATVNSTPLIHTNRSALPAHTQPLTGYSSYQVQSSAASSHSSSSRPWASTPPPVSSANTGSSTTAVYDQTGSTYHHPISTIQSNYQQAPPTPVLPPPDLQPVIDKMAAYVAKNGSAFEKTVLEKHVGDPKFSFLSPWDKLHGYYQSRVQEVKERLLQESRMYSGELGPVQYVGVAPVDYRGPMQYAPMDRPPVQYGPPDSRPQLTQLQYLPPPPPPPPPSHGDNRTLIQYAPAPVQYENRPPVQYGSTSERPPLISAPLEDRTPSNVQRLADGSVKFTIAPRAPQHTSQEEGEDEEEGEGLAPMAKRPRTDNQHDKGEEKMENNVQMLSSSEFLAHGQVNASLKSITT